MSRKDPKEALKISEISEKSQNKVDLKLRKGISHPRPIQSDSRLVLPPLCLFQSDIITLCLKYRGDMNYKWEKYQIYARPKLFKGLE